MIISPCISICKTDPKTGLCYGCGRNDEEKRKWKEENTSDQWKVNNLEEIKSRLSGWQLESFKSSYSNKIKEWINYYLKNNEYQVDDKIINFFIENYNDDMSNIINEIA